MNDALLLIGRVLVALLFLMTVLVGGPSSGYLNSLGFPAPDVCSVIARTAEWLIILSMILGAATRTGALLGIVYVVVATAVAHRYWEVPPAQHLFQYTNFSKNLAILGAFLFIYVTGAGALSVDRLWRSRRAAGS